MLEKLSEDQQRLMAEVRQEWLDTFFSSVDEAKAEKLAKWVYELAGLKPPKIIFVDSPLGCQLAANMLPQKKEDQVGNQVGNQVRNQVRDQVRDQDMLQYFTPAYYADSSDFGWVSFYDYFRQIGITKHEKFDEYVELIKANIFYWVALKNTAIISKPPTFTKRNDKGRLHCTTDYAIYFDDGYGQHYVNGVHFEPALFETAFKKQTIKPTQILALQNTEQKAVIIQHQGYDKIVQKISGLRVLDEVKDKSKVDGKPIKYQVLEFPLDQATIRVVRVEDHSLHKITCLGVPKEKQTETCRGAIKWTFGLGQKERYAPQTET